MTISPKRIYNLDELTDALSTYKLLIDDGTLSEAQYITVANLLKGVLSIEAGQVDFQGADLINIGDITVTGAINWAHFAKSLGKRAEFANDQSTWTFTQIYNLFDESEFLNDDLSYNNIILQNNAATADYKTLKFTKPGWYKIILNQEGDARGISGGTDPVVDNTSTVTYKTDIIISDYDDVGDTLTEIRRYSFRKDEYANITNMNKTQFVPTNGASSFFRNQQECHIYIANELTNRLKIEVENDVSIDYSLLANDAYFDNYHNLTVQATE